MQMSHGSVTKTSFISHSQMKVTVTEHARSHERLLGVFPDTWVWVLQLLLKPGKSGAKGFRVLQKHFVHNQDCFLSNVGLSVGHL